MEVPRQATGAAGSAGGARASVAQPYLRPQPAKPLTSRQKLVLDYRRLSRYYGELADVMERNGLEERPAPRKPTYAERLRQGLESGRFNPPNADELLADLGFARAGDRAARERIIDYLSQDGVLEVLDA